MSMSVDGQNAVVDAYLASVPTFEIGFFEGDPYIDGVEVTGGGYVRPTIDDTDWGAASGGAASNDVEILFADATDEWDRSATHWAPFVSGDPDPWPGGGELVDELMVTAAGPGPVIPVGGLVVFYESSVDEGV